MIKSFYSAVYQFSFQVHLSFLYVGHTHEDVDAAFSKVADKLRKTDVEVLQDLIDVIDGEVLDSIFDVKSWLAPEIKTSWHQHTSSL